MFSLVEVAKVVPEVVAKGIKLLKRAAFPLRQALGRKSVVLLRNFIHTAIFFLNVFIFFTFLANQCLHKLCFIIW